MEQLFTYRIFTFQYGSILTKKIVTYFYELYKFTFQYGSILTHFHVIECIFGIIFTFQYGSILTHQYTSYYIACL